MKQNKQFYGFIPSFYEALHLTWSPPQVFSEWVFLSNATCKLCFEHKWPFEDEINLWQQMPEWSQQKKKITL